MFESPADELCGSEHKRFKKNLIRLNGLEDNDM